MYNEIWIHYSMLFADILEEDERLKILCDDNTMLSKIESSNIYVKEVKFLCCD
jgi:hypothetical protein